jgi:hypothetical protein
MNDIADFEAFLFSSVFAWLSQNRPRTGMSWWFSVEEKAIWVPPWCRELQDTYFSWPYEISGYIWLIWVIYGIWLDMG